MHSTTRESEPIGTTAGPPVDCATDGDVRVVYNAVRTLVPDAATLAIDELLAVTRLEPDVATAAMDRLAREAPMSIHRIAGERAWLVRRTDR